MLSAKRARQITEKRIPKLLTTLKQVDENIKRHAGLGFTNIILDVENSLVERSLKAKLEAQGFRVFVEPEEGLDYSVVHIEW
jgi:hypothetical protein